MAVGDRLNLFHLYSWQRFSWARNANGTERATYLQTPSVTSVDATTAVITVGMQNLPSKIRLVYGKRSKTGYGKRTAPAVQPSQPQTVSFSLKELESGTTYYLTAIGTLGPLDPPPAWPGGYDRTGEPWNSPELSFSTPVAP